MNQFRLGQENAGLKEKGFQEKVEMHRLHNAFECLKGDL